MRDEKARGKPTRGCKFNINLCLFTDKFTLISVILLCCAIGMIWDILKMGISPLP